MAIIAQAHMPWAQFGLAGLVIAALFGVLAHFMRSHRDERTEMANLHRAERAEWRGASAEERDEARKREEALHGGLQDALVSLKGVIRDSKA